MEKPNSNSFDWAPHLKAEFDSAWGNGQVGKSLVSESDRVRVWHLSLKPGERIGFHMHVLDYFWTALTSGRSQSHMQDGCVVETTYDAGITKHFTFGNGEYMLHDLKNVGDTELQFVTVEFLDSVNTSLALADHS